MDSGRAQPSGSPALAGSAWRPLSRTTCASPFVAQSRREPNLRDASGPTHPGSPPSKGWIMCDGHSTLGKCWRMASTGAGAPQAGHG